MSIRLTAAQAKQYGIRGKTVLQPKKPRRQDGYASQLEADYAQELSRQYLYQEIREWRYEPLRFLLAHKTTYVPDFLVEPLKGKLEIHETKGYFWPKDRLKVKFTARIFPMFRFIVVRRVNGLWEYEEIQG